ncbi:MAG TPA: SRPBCC domain-containing protein [Cytophagales bacterium]|nr:SRPBCC domain-containing protein [Cytophagales bacterium]
MDNKEAAVRITHIFDATPDLVFEAWTDPEQLLLWYAPQGCKLFYKHIEVRKGGTFHSCIQDPLYGDCWCKGTYLEIDPPYKLVYTVALCDAEGNSVQSAQVGKDGAWPSSTTVTVFFTPVGNKTQVQLHQNVSESLAKKTGAYPSWIQMLERLNERFKETNASSL